MIQRSSEERRIKPATLAEVREEWKTQCGLISEQWFEDMIRNKSLRTATSAAIPTTPRVVERLVELLELEELKDGDVVAEAGPGPGPIVQAVLREVRAKITYVAIELNEKFAHHLEDTVDDSRLVVINDDAAKIEEITHKYGKKAKRVISSMPFSNNESLTKTILRQIKGILAEDGKFLMANFTGKSIRLVEEAFGKESCTTDFFFNSPPLPPIIRTIVAGKPQKNGSH